MERFMKIDWKPAIDDVLDNVFVNEERLEKESTMYKVLVGDFTDPFENMEEEYEQVNIDFIKATPSRRERTRLKAAAKNALQNNLTADEACNEPSKSVQEASDIVNKSYEENEEKNEEKSLNETKRTYVPGLTKGPIRFSRMSDLSKDEQATCLRVLVKIYSSPLEKPDFSQIDKEDLRTYMNLKEIIDEEQNAYIDHVKTKWNEVSLKLCCEGYTNLKWRHKIQKANELPRYYIEKTNVPFIGSNDIAIKFLLSCLELGHVPEIKLPTFTRPYKLKTSSRQLQEQFPIPNEKNEPIPHFKLPVSQDPQCEFLAQTTQADMVISSSGLNCLVNSVGPHYANAWTLPIVIRRHNGKNVIYVEKPIPPNSSTIIEKNTWVYKYILRQFLVCSKRSFRQRKKSVDEQRMYEDVENPLFRNIYSDEHLKLEEQYDTEKNIGQHRTENSLWTSLTDIDTHSRSSSISSISNELEIHSVQESEYEKQSNAKEYSGYNVSYKLFSIGSASETQNQLAKDIINAYKILVRAKIDGVEKLEDGTQQPLLLAPKLEHQIQYGAEAVSLEEASKQWMSLLFRPETILARARIAAETGEVLQVEKHSVISINNEIKRLYNVKVEESLTILHNVIHILLPLTPGRYILRHTLKNGAFATVYKQTDTLEKNGLDLQTLCGLKDFLTIPKTPWPKLDKLAILPLHKCFQRMPLMFFPPKVSKRKDKKKYQAPVRKSKRTKSIAENKA